MTFTIKYRAKNGAVAEETIEAANRSDCFAKCKERAIAPMSVREGSGKGKSGGVRSGLHTLNSKVITVVACFLISGVSIWFWIGNEPAKTEKASVKKTEKKETSRKSPNPVINDPVEMTSGKKLNSGNKVSGMKSGNFSPPELPAEGSASNTPALPSIPPTTFNNASDQVLAMITSGDETGSVPPIPISRDIETEFLNSLKQEIVILDTDDEKTRKIKEAVIAARAEMKRMVDSGMTVSQVIAEHQRLASENAEVRNKAMFELKEIIESGDLKGAEEYKRKINIALQQMGISELSIPVTEEEKEERAIARRERMLKKRARQSAAQKDGDRVP